MSTSEPQGTIRLDAHAIRVLAHPLRARALTALRVDGPATATTLAARLGTHTGATSYHLRRLASVGLVEETGEGRGRERWWRPTSRSHSFFASDVEDSPDARASLTWLRLHYLEQLEERAALWYAHEHEHNRAWQDAAGTSDEVLALDAAGTAALVEELTAVVERFRGRPASDADDVRRVFVAVTALPEVGPAR
ncbi:winged helix-turn-helix domain-containing protein [Cellulomonas massiliensis]|uniref:winged helix-turn-helix domain-containing protein n=1 Tax=Cellulomonas massiliensis TaxID=1465811 RepID=UPI0002E4BBC7|nr:helix-turn-helix domain-containing protein [Cellulomonas massiliensis]